MSRKKGEKAEAGFNGSRNNDVSSVGTSFQLVRPDCQLVVSRSGKETQRGGFRGTYVPTYVYMYVRTNAWTACWPSMCEIDVI